MELWNELRHRLTFIVGSAKNAGKTTFMNLAVRSLRADGPVALITIGVDGEGRDQLFGTPKPLVPVEEGDWIVTTQTALNASTGLFRVAQAYPVSTMLGRLVLAQCSRADYCELIGPETNSQLESILSDIVSNQKIDTILVDGSVNRITQISSAPNAGIVDVVKVTPNTVDSATEHIRQRSLLFALPQFDKPSLPKGWVECTGALTQEKLAALPKGIKGVVVENLSSVFLNSKTLNHLPCPLHVRRTFPLRALVVNAMDVDETDFAKRFEGLPIAERLVFNLHKERRA